MSVPVGYKGPLVELLEDGRLPSSVEGGYPLTYYTEDGGQLCPGCANGDNGSLASVTETDPQWRVVGSDIFYEGPPYFCDHCGVEQESAYGDPHAGGTA